MHNYATSIQTYKGCNIDSLCRRLRFRKDALTDSDRDFLARDLLEQHSADDFGNVLVERELAAQMTSEPVGWSFDAERWESIMQELIVRHPSGGFLSIDSAGIGLCDDLDEAFGRSTSEYFLRSGLPNGRALRFEERQPAADPQVTMPTPAFLFALSGHEQRRLQRAEERGELFETVQKRYQKTMQKLSAM